MHSKGIVNWIAHKGPKIEIHECYFFLDEPKKEIENSTPFPVDIIDGQQCSENDTRNKETCV